MVVQDLRAAYHLIEYYSVVNYCSPSSFWINFILKQYMVSFFQSNTGDEEDNDEIAALGLSDEVVAGNCDYLIKQLDINTHCKLRILTNIQTEPVRCNKFCTSKLEPIRAQ